MNVFAKTLRKSVLVRCGSIKKCWEKKLFQLRLFVKSVILNMKKVIVKKINYVMGIDPAWSKPIAWAIADGERILKYNKWPSGKKLQLEDIRLPCQKIYIEGQHKQNMKVMQQLAMTVGQIIMGAKISNIPWEIVNPSNWIVSYRLHTRMGRKALEPAYINLSRAMTGEKINDVDIAVACLIAMYGARRERSLNG